MTTIRLLKRYIYSVIGNGSQLALSSPSGIHTDALLWDDIFENMIRAYRNSAFLNFNGIFPRFFEAWFCSVRENQTNTWGSLDHGTSRTTQTLAMTHLQLQHFIFSPRDSTFLPAAIMVSSIWDSLRLFLIVSSRVCVYCSACVCACISSLSVRF